ncbi:MAG TPA: hypothetical protein DE044_13630, partial [Alteromonas macleodii]|nr:hypothetical protein [Alteromonas macleodii]
MTAIKAIFTPDFLSQYRTKALEESGAYLVIAENLQLASNEINNNIDKILTLTQQLVTLNNEKITSNSVSAVIKKLSKD